MVHAFVPQLLVMGLCIGYAGLVQGRPLIDHNLEVTIEPEEGVLTVKDTLTLLSAELFEGDSLFFNLRAGLQPRVDAPDIKLIPFEKEYLGHILVQRYRIQLPAHRQTFTLSYHGRISDPHADTGNTSEPPSRHETGAISAEGVYLNETSAWYPRFDQETLTFRLEVSLPAGWSAVSQGQRTRQTQRDGRTVVQWVERQPQQEIHLIANRFHETSRSNPIADAMIFLRQRDDITAARYLEATERYLELYTRLLGPYPYDKFALVENFWETGYGMPSFTLLGPSVIRLPFILHSSYPHEILHNWWGNGVYIAYEEGNWSEGLTAYLADHLVEEQRGRGAVYRRAALQKYASYVHTQRDFPLAEFRARHGEASQAVGYNKAMMFFHMLRLRLGDKAFVEGLRQFYRQNRFHRAGYAALRKSFENASRLNLAPMFSQWIERTGAPSLAIHGVKTYNTADSHILEAVLTQTQTEPAFELQIPLAIALDNRNQAYETTVSMSNKEEKITLHIPQAPRVLSVDPRFDVFRRLLRSELPTSLGQIFGSERVTLVIPSEAPEALKQGYLKLAQRWAATDNDVEILLDDSLTALPADRSTWLFGWDNRLRTQLLNGLSNQPVNVSETTAQIQARRFERDHHSVVIVGVHPDAPSVTVAWLGCDNPAAVAGLARKLPHYGKYSYLAFEGDAPNNVAKGQWPVVNSPLRIRMNNEDTTRDSPKLPPRPPLSRLASPITE